MQLQLNTNNNYIGE